MIATLSVLLGLGWQSISQPIAHVNAATLSVEHVHKPKKHPKTRHKHRKVYRVKRRKQTTYKHKRRRFVAKKVTKKKLHKVARKHRYYKPLKRRVKLRGKKHVATKKARRIKSLKKGAKKQHKIVTKKKTRKLRPKKHFKKKYRKKATKKGFKKRAKAGTRHVGKKKAKPIAKKRPKTKVVVNPQSEKRVKKPKKTVPALPPKVQPQVEPKDSGKTDTTPQTNNTTQPDTKPQQPTNHNQVTKFNASSAPLRLQNGGQVSDNTVHSVYNHTVAGFNFDYKVGTESTGYNVPKEFIKYAKEMYPLWLNESTVPSAGDDRAMIAGHLDTYIDEHPEVRKQSFHFVANQKDVNRYVDVYNLSDHDRMELSSFLVQLNNNIRYQFGLDGYHTTHVMDQIADRIGIEYDRDNWTWGPNRRHDFAGINRLAEYFGFVQGNDYDTQYLENNVYFNYLKPQYLSHISMADLKANIYMCFGDMWFGDGGDTEYSHVCSLLGSDKNTSMAVAFDHQGFMHFVSSDFYNIVSDNTKQDLLNSQYSFTDY